MRLSMNMLADWLAPYKPKISITGGKRQIRNVRPFSEEHDLIPSNVYVSRMGAGKGSGVMCINENDFIFIPAAEADDIIYEIMEAFDFYNSWSDDLIEHLAELTIQQILDKSRNVIPHFMIVADPAYYALAYTALTDQLLENQSLAHMNEHNIVDMPMILAIETDPRIRLNNRRAYHMDCAEFGFPPMVRNLFVRGTHIAWLIVVGESYTPGTCDLIDELGDILERRREMLSLNNGESELGRLLQDLLEHKETDRNQLLNLLRFNSFQNEQEIVLYCTEFSGNTSGYSILSRLKRMAPHICNLIYEGKIVSILFGNADDRKYFEEQADPLIREAGGRCTCSPVFTDVFELPELYTLTGGLCDILLSENEGKVIAHFEDYALLYAKNLLVREMGSHLIHPAVTVLKQYDAENNTSLLKTLHVYLLHERNYADTARALYIHRNTLLYRIERIGELTQADLDDPDVRLQILLSFADDSNLPDTVFCEQGAGTKAQIKRAEIETEK